MPTASITNGIQVQLLRSKLILSMHFPYLSPMENFGVVVKYGICFSGDTPDGLQQVESCSAIKCAYNDPMHQNFSRRLGLYASVLIYRPERAGSLKLQCIWVVALTLTKQLTKPTVRSILSLRIIQEQNIFGSLNN